MRRSDRRQMNPIFRYKTGSGTTHTVTPVQPRYFSATVDRDIKHLRVGQKVVFNRVLTDSHGDYDQYSGKFTCQEAGPYFLTVTIGTYPGTAVGVDIFQNGVMRRQIIASSSNNEYGYGTGSCILSLRTGDIVWVQMGDFPSKTVTKWYSEINCFLIR